MENSKKKIVIIIVVVIAVFTVISIWFVLRNSNTIDKQTIINEKQQVVEVEKDMAVSDQAITDQEKIEFNQAIEETLKIDKDFDGILDQDESKYGTSVTSSDTDEDGLLDRDEIFKYKTDPLKADTDGDGYDDGQEVRNGYNPNGEGNL
ncbi:MAG: hypothetical protein ABIH87_01770 [bacterium]